MIKKYFQFDQLNTSLHTEIVAGFTTFVTLCYIIVVNPAILSSAGMDHDAVFVATIIISALSSFCMGVVANYPVALAPTMGMNAYFTFAVVKSMGYHWETALSAVLISGVLFLLFTLCRLRRWVIDTLPLFLIIAISTGIGAFLGMIALTQSGLLIAAPKTLPHLGSLHHIETYICLISFGFILFLNRYRVPGAIIIGILLATVISLVLGKAKFHGIFALPPSIHPTFLALSIKDAINLNFISVVLTFFFIGFFDTTGTLIGLLHRAGLMTHNLDDPRFKKALIVDSSANIVAPVLGTSVVGCFIESASGIYAGGRSGFTAVVVSVLFLAMLFFAPLVDTIPKQASAAALLFVACMMLRGLKEIKWRDFHQALPSAVTILITPLTFSIAYGISFGYLTHIFLQLLTGKFRNLSRNSVILAILLLAYLIAAAR